MLPPRVTPSAATVRAAWSSPRIRTARSTRYSSPCPSVGAPAPGARCARRDHREPVAFRAQSWTLSIARCPMLAIRKDSSSVTALPARAPSPIMTLHTAVLMSHNARRTGALGGILDGDKLVRLQRVSQQQCASPEANCTSRRSGRLQGALRARSSLNWAFSVQIKWEPTRRTHGVQKRSRRDRRAVRQGLRQPGLGQFGELIRCRGQAVAARVSPG
jgi:hypothetical protein